MEAQCNKIAVVEIQWINLSTLTKVDMPWRKSRNIDKVQSLAQSPGRKCPYFGDIQIPTVYASCSKNGMQ